MVRCLPSRARVDQVDLAERSTAGTCAPRVRGGSGRGRGTRRGLPLLHRDRRVGDGEAAATAKPANASEIRHDRSVLCPASSCHQFPSGAVTPLDKHARALVVRVRFQTRLTEVLCFGLF